MPNRPLSFAVSAHLSFSFFFSLSLLRHPPALFFTVVSLLFLFACSQIALLCIAVTALSSYAPLDMSLKWGENSWSLVEQGEKTDAEVELLTPEFPLNLTITTDSAEPVNFFFYYTVSDLSNSAFLSFFFIFLLLFRRRSMAQILITVYTTSQPNLLSLHLPPCPQILRWL